MIAATMQTTPLTPVEEAVGELLLELRLTAATDLVTEARADQAALLGHLFRPRLHLVAHFAPGELARQGEPISLADALSFRAWYVSKEPSEEEAKAAQRLLGLGNQKMLWLACGCRPDKPQDPPVLSCIETKRGNGVYTPRRRTDRTPHAWFCFLRFEPRAKVLDTASTSEDGGRVDIDLLRGHGVRESPERRQARGGPSEVGDPTSAVSFSTHSALMVILKMAGCTRITSSRSFKGEVASIERYAAGVHHRKNEMLTLARCLVMNPDRPDDPGLLERVFAQSSRLWPKGELAVGYVLMIASKVFKNEDGSCAAQIETVKGWGRSKAGQVFPRIKQTPVTFNFPVRVAEPAGECVRAPYILFLRAEISAAGTPIWIDGVAQPIAARGFWVPVPSIAEREAVFSMRSVIAELDAAGIQHNIVKRIGTIRNDAGETCEPDFMATKIDIDMDQEQLLLETQKTARKSYHDRKLKQHRIMEDIGALYIDDRLKHSRSVADAKLRDRLRRFYGLSQETGPEDSDQ